MMLLTAFELVPFAAMLSMNTMAVSMLFAVVRLFRGPSIPDRVIALDLIAALSVGMIAIYSIGNDEPMLLRAGIIVALVVFIGTVAFAMFVEKRGHD